jgi:biopolymer transport protein ExbB/TolQ
MTYFTSGGMTMYPLLFCSVLIWAIVFEKLWSLSRFTRHSRFLYAKALSLVKEKRLDEAKGLYAASDSAISAPHLALFEGTHLPQAVLSERIGRQLDETQAYLRRYMWPMGTIGVIAPFLGLFGTITGIMKSFSSIAEAGKSNFSVVAAGLSEALVTTAFGIIIAVVALVFYNYLQGRIQLVSMEFKNRIEELAEVIFHG